MIVLILLIILTLAAVGAGLFQMSQQQHVNAALETGGGRR